VDVSIYRKRRLLPLRYNSGECLVCALNHSAAICRRMSPTLKSGVVAFSPKIGEEGLTDVSQIVAPSGAVVCERNRVDIFCSLSTMHERDRQTNTQNGNKQNDRLSVMHVA